MLKKLKQFLGLKRRDKLLFIEAFCTLAFVRATMLLLPFERLTRGLTQKHDKNWITLLPFHSMQHALRISWAICHAANNTPWESACLAQSLCARKMLQRQKIPGVFYLGVMKDETSKEKMKAHAWSEAGEKILTGGTGYESYSVISVYTWGSQ